MHLPQGHPECASLFWSLWVHFPRGAHTWLGGSGWLVSEPRGRYARLLTVHPAFIPMPDPAELRTTRGRWELAGIVPQHSRACEGLAGPWWSAGLALTAVLPGRALGRLWGRQSAEEGSSAARLSDTLLQSALHSDPTARKNLLFSRCANAYYISELTSFGGGLRSGWNTSLRLRFSVRICGQYNLM